MQFDLIEDDHQEHLVFIRLVNTIHDQDFVISLQDDLRTFS